MCSIAREFITRAVLATRADLGDILDVLTNEGVGTADGFNMNFAFLHVPNESRVFHTVEVTPKADSDRSEVYLADFGIGSNSIHTNKCVHGALHRHSLLQNLVNIEGNTPAVLGGSDVVHLMKKIFTSHG